MAIENEYISYKGLDQSNKYDGNWDIPVYNKESLNGWMVKPGSFIEDFYYGHGGGLKYGNKEINIFYVFFFNGNFRNRR